MGWFNDFRNKYPYTDFHELNLSWFLDEFIRLKEEIKNFYVDFSKVIVEEVNKWLDEHPEATTTVEDGSITEEKFSDSLKLSAINNFITPEMYGAIGDGVADDTNALQNTFNEGKPVFLSGKYKVTSTIEASNTTEVVSDNAEIIADYDGVVLSFDKLSYEYLGNLTTSVNEGSYTPAFSGANVNDIVFITSTDLFNSARNYYKHGEINKIVSANMLDHGYYSDYDFNNTTVFKMNPGSLTMSGSLSVINTHNSENATSVLFSGIANGFIDGLYARSYGTNAVKVSRCYKCDIDIVSECYANTYGTDYGLVIVNSQDITVHGKYYGNRHAVSVGGDGNALNIVNRNIKIDAITHNNASLEQASMDLHGNCEYCTLSGNADTGVSLGGKNIIVHDIITPKNPHSVGIIGSEMLAGNFTFSNLIIDATRTTSGLRLDSNIDTGDTYDIVISNCILSNATGNAVMLRGDSRDSIKITMNNVSCKDNTSYIVNNSRANAPLANVIASNIYNTDFQYNRCNKRQPVFYKGSFDIVFNNASSVSQYITYPMQTTRPDIKLQILNPASLGPVIIPTVHELYGHEARIFSYTMSGANATGTVTCYYELSYTDF